MTLLSLSGALFLLALGLTWGASGETVSPSPNAQRGMALIPADSYIRPLEKDGKPRAVEAFYLDTRPVTNADYLSFLKAHPKWRRSQINRLFADKSYLRHWKDDLDPGPAAPPDAPVTHVSWFAARAYLKTQGKKLPTVDQWELAARASAEQPDATKDPAFKTQILEWYARPNPEVLPPVDTYPPDFHGVRGLHGLVWEWTRDFNSALATGESRADGSGDSALFCGGAGLNKNSATEYADFMRFAMRSSLKGNYCLASLGFRGARTPSPPQSAPPTK